MATLADYPDDWEEIFLSNPNFSVVEYTRKMTEYQRLLKAKQDVDVTSGMGEGAGSAGNVQWGGGTFSPTEYATGDLDIVADEDLPPGVTQDAQGNRYRVDDLNNTISMGARKPGLDIVRNILPNIVNLIPGYSAIKSIYDSQNKTDDTTTASSTDTGTTNTGILPALMASGTLPVNMTGSMPNNMSITSAYDYGTSPVATAITGNGGGGIIEAMIAAGADPNDPFGDPTGFM